MQHNLRTALIHLKVEWAKPKENREAILGLCEKAIQDGAKLMVSPEMGLSGYCFEDRDAILPCTEPADGPTAVAISKLAKSHKVFIISAWAEIDKSTRMLYNSTFAFGPNGDLLSFYRKINAESRWACPGHPRQENTFETPWGRAGLLICSDSYHSLPTRITALKGANLLLLPANWPPTRHFPGSIWRFRALENKLYVLAVNRSGVESNLDCSTGRSYVFGPKGECLLDKNTSESEVFLTDILLDSNGKLPNIALQKDFFQKRKPQEYYRVYSNLLFFKNLSQTLKLPTPGPQDTHFMATGKGLDPVDYLERRLNSLLPENLVILPRYNYTDSHKDRLINISKEKELKILTAAKTPHGPIYWSVDKDLKTITPATDNITPPIHVGPLVVGFVEMESMLHPELAISYAKKGGDLLLAIEESLGPDDRFISSMRPIDQIAAAVVTQTGAVVALVPEGHSPPRGAYAEEGFDICYTLDSKEIRDKHFQDRMDFEVLFDNYYQSAGEQSKPENMEQEKSA
ncbi:MAG: carbon-nitrogen hydrolase family protein [Deltaproteobacteria bacterium]|jgi:predicted amidohydrolase|nr:carbon-nitrogen hydrolase family protein [Deltaproteobacteria bacterium]